MNYAIVCNMETKQWDLWLDEEVMVGSYSSRQEALEERERLAAEDHQARFELP